MTTASRQHRKSEGSRALNVHLLHPPPDPALSCLAEQLDPGVQLTTGADRIPSETHVLVHGRPSENLLEDCPQLRALIIPYAGVPAETRELLLRCCPMLPVYNLHHNAIAASELALALLLAAAKTLLPVDRAFRRGDWRSRYNGAPTLLLEGKTAVILGYGAIGKRISDVCSALGLNVHAVRRHPETPSPDSITIHGLDALHSMLPCADILIIALPLTDETTALLGARELARLPSSCVLVNVARGAIVDEEALYHALSTRSIAAAGIDVWYTYPKTADAQAETHPSRFPFYELDNVVMSPHRGGAFRLEELERRRMNDLAKSLNAMARDQAVPHRVDLHAGY